MSQRNQDNEYVDFYLKPGSFYRASREPKEGYEKITYGKEGDKKTTYHKLVESVSGELVGMTISTHPTIGDQVKLYLAQEDEFIFVIVFPLYNRFGDISGWADSFARMVGNLSKKQNYTFEPNTERVSDEGRPYEGFVITEAEGEEVRWTIENDDVPKLVKDTNVAGKVTYDGKERTNYLLSLLLKKVKRKERKSSDQPKETNRAKPEAERATTKETTREVVEAEVVSETKDTPKDDLPF